MSILVTGASGYIGRHVVTTLLDKGCNVIAADFNTSPIDKRAHSITCNIFNSDINFVKQYNCSTVIHLAWQNGFVHNDDSHIKNLYSHYDFLRKLEHQGIKHFVIMGSMHEVGYHEGIIDETTPTNPVSPYAIAKNSLRQLLTTYFSNKDVTFQWLRGFYIYNDDFYNHSIFTKILEAEKKGQKLFPFTKGTNKYDFITVEELAQQISSVALQNKVVGIINCCSGKPVMLKDKIEDFIKTNNLNIRLDYGKFPDRVYDSPIIYGDTTKIKSIMENR